MLLHLRPMRLFFAAQLGLVVLVFHVGHCAKLSRSVQTVLRDVVTTCSSAICPRIGRNASRCGSYCSGRKSSGENRGRLGLKWQRHGQYNHANELELEYLLNVPLSTLRVRRLNQQRQSTEGPAPTARHNDNLAVGTTKNTHKNHNYKVSSETQINTKNPNN